MALNSQQVACELSRYRERRYLSREYGHSPLRTDISSRNVLWDLYAAICHVEKAYLLSASPIGRGCFVYYLRIGAPVLLIEF